MRYGKGHYYRRSSYRSRGRSRRYGRYGNYRWRYY